MSTIEHIHTNEMGKSQSDAISSDNRFLIVQTDEHDLYFECNTNWAAEDLMSILDNLMRLRCRGKFPNALRGMHLSSDTEGAEPMPPDISKELFGVKLFAMQA